MSARDELPPCRCIDHYPGSYLPDECRSCRALGTLRITREELATMRAAVERCAELERAKGQAVSDYLAMSRAEIATAEARDKAEAALAEMTTNHERAMNAWSGECERGTTAYLRAKVELESMEAQRDEARAAAETLRDEACHPTDPENPRRTLPWEVG